MGYMEKLETFTWTCWEDILTLVCEAAVFLDSAIIECLHWDTGDNGYLTLKAAGAVSVHELAAYNLRHANVNGAKKAVIISNSTQPDSYEYAVKILMEKNTFESCIIITTVHCDIINYGHTLSQEEISRYCKMKRNLRNWLNSNCYAKECFLDVVYVPIFFILISENLVITPPFANLMPPLNGHITNELTANVNHFVSLWDSLFRHLNIIEDIYWMGNFSEHIAEKLKNFPLAVERRNKLTGSGAAIPKVSFIIMDRTLDLCAATSYDTKSVFAKMLYTLPHLSNHSNDVMVNMTPLICETQTDPPFLEISGCIATKDKSMINTLISKKQQDVLLTANQALHNMLLTKDSPKSKVATRISIHSIEKLVYKLHQTENPHYNLESSKQLQIIWAIVQSLKSDKNVQLELLLSIEKLISQNLAVSRDSSSVLSQLSNIIKTRNNRGLDTENLLALLIYVYALAGTQIQFSAAQIQLLRESLSEALYEDMKILNENANINVTSVYQQTLLLLGADNDSLRKEISVKTAKHIMQMLYTVSQQRSSLSKYISLLSNPHPSEMIEYVGILEQLVTDMLHPDRPKLQDLHKKSMTQSLTPFNLFSKSKSDHHPVDNRWIIIYVVGGITAEEVKRVQEIASKSEEKCVITFAGSQLLNPLDMVDRILLSTIND